MNLKFVTIDTWTMIFTWVNLLILFLLLKKFLFKPVMKMIADRQQEIDGMYADADKAKTEAAAMEADYRQRLENAAQTSERMMKEAVVRAQAREDEIVTQAKVEAAAIMDKAVADIAQEKKKAVNDAKDEISEMAMAIAGKVVGRALNSEDQAALVDHFIDELGEQA